MTKMTDAQLLAYIERQENRSKRPDTAQEQALAMHYYLSRPLGNEEEGRSQVISSDVWDVVEGLTPLVAKPFVSSDEVVTFNPVGADDEEAAQQESDYINYVVTQKNDAFETFITWIKSGLMQKNGVVKYWWDSTRRVSIENYSGLSDDMYTQLIADDSVSVLQHSEYPGPLPIDPATGMPAADSQTGMPVQPELLHDVRIRSVDTVGQARYEVLPPEEFRITTDARSPDPKKSGFCQHLARKTISEIRQLGYDIDDDVSDSGTTDVSMDPQATERLTDSERLIEFDGGGDPSMREVWLRESYCFVDYDGDGIAERRKICAVGSTILDNEEIEEWPFAGWTPYQQLFQFPGRCPADETIEIQQVKSTLWRQSLDNIYTINNNRTYVSDKVNLDDMLDNAIAGVVRVSGDVVSNHAMSMPITPIGQVVQPMIEYLDSAKENRTGFTRYNQGTDANSLNKTATGIQIIKEAGNERVGLVSRSLAEQGMKPLMLGIHRLCRQHATKAETVRLRGKWVRIDPREWKTRCDMTVSVGLGTADKTMQLQAQDSIVKMQTGLMQLGIVQPQNLYNAASKYVELTGEKDPDKYFSHPDKMPKQEPPDPTQNPEYMLKVKEMQQKDKELELKARALDQIDQKQGIDATNAHIDALERHATLAMAQEKHARDMAAPHPSELAAQQQAHGQAIDVRQQQMAEQGQAHGQQMAEEAVEAPQSEPAEQEPANG